MMDENEKLRGDISSGRDREQALGSELEELRNKITNIDSKVSVRLPSVFKDSESNIVTGNEITSFVVIGVR